MVSTYSLAATIVANNDREGRVELDDLDVLVVKGTDTAYGQLVEGCPEQIVRRATRHKLDRNGTLTWLVVCRGREVEVVQPRGVGVTGTGVLGVLSGLGVFWEVSAAVRGQ